jgi:hypothetical protein
MGLSLLNLENETCSDFTIGYFCHLLPARWGWAMSREANNCPRSYEVTSFHPAALVGRFFPQTHVSQAELTAGWPCVTPICTVCVGLGSCHAVLLFPFSP